jgi:DNA (cytosine-5)-methyltransferase 1
MITVGSLFSGIGGLEYGLERTGGFKTIWQSEIDPYASAVLRKHWPEVPNLGDITKIEWGTVAKPDLICGGFPCQDISIAGKGKGILEGARSKLWSEFARCLREIRPSYALVENVPELANRGLWLVLADLAKMGYDAEWGIISACSCGAPHTRERLLIMAYASSNGLNVPLYAKRQQPNNHAEWEEKKEMQERGNFWIDASTRSWWATEPRMDRVANGIPNQAYRIKCLGNAVVPQVAQVVGEMILEKEKVSE